MSMNAEPKRLWLEALRSGKYQQVASSLRRTEDGVDFYCCLGVACEVAIKAGVQLDRGEPFGDGEYCYFEYCYEDGSASVLPSVVQDWLGTYEADPSVGGRPGDTLAGMNDAGSSFADIADLIEAQL